MSWIPFSWFPFFLSKSEISLKKKTEARVGIEPTIRIFTQTPSGLSGARTQPSEPSKHSTFFYQFLSTLFFPPSSPWSDQSSCEWFENWEVFLVFFSASEIEINWVCLSFKTFLLANLHQPKLVAMWETLLSSLLHYGLERTIRKL